MKSRWIIVLCVTLLWTAGWAPSLIAAPQDAPSPAEETEAARESEAGEGEAGEKKFENGLYVEVGVGTNDFDPLDTTVRTSSRQLSLNSFELLDMDHARAVLGWRLPGNKGSFRLKWDAFNENGHDFSAIGRYDGLGVAIPPATQIGQNLDWWLLDVTDGALNVQQTPPVWTLDDDLIVNGGNEDGMIQRNEVTYPLVSYSNSSMIEPDLQNRVQVADILYGRVFGPRRIEGTWWGGMRYFAYEGTLLQGAWLQSPSPSGFTDGTLLRLIHAAQKTTAIGPTGSLGFQANFFDKRFQLFMMGQFAFTISDVETDTGDFFAIVESFNNDTALTAPARLQANRSRTSWQTHVEAGMRLNLKNGLILEVAYFNGGFLDAVLTPTEIRIPQSSIEVPNGVSAIFATQDIVYDGWRSAVAFQF